MTGVSNLSRSTRAKARGGLRSGLLRQQGHSNGIKQTPPARTGRRSEENEDREESENNDEEARRRRTAKKKRRIKKNDGVSCGTWKERDPVRTRPATSVAELHTRDNCKLPLSPAVHKLFCGRPKPKPQSRSADETGRGARAALRKPARRRTPPPANGHAYALHGKLKQTIELRMVSLLAV